MAEQPDPLHSPDPSLSGPDVEAAVQNAESGTATEDVHHPAGPGEEGDSRPEQMREVDTGSE